jgi:TPR repeat protein
MIGTGARRALASVVVAALLAAAVAHAQTGPEATPAPPRDTTAPANLMALPIEELRARANSNDVAAMEELGRRLIQGTEVTKDPQAGAGWLLRAAELGSAQSAFNVGVMYERGFVVERNSAKAVEWYRKAADAGLPVAKHNLALMLREGKGVARDTKAAIELFKSAARQGLAASMFSLGDIYDRGDAAPRDAVEAVAWFAVAAEIERQLNGGAETQLARTADQRVEALRRTLTPEELARARDRARGEFKLIVETMQPPRTPAARPPAESSAPALPAPVLPDPAAPAAGEAKPAAPARPAADDVAWPAGAAEQVRVVQQLLFDMGLLHAKPDGSTGPKTRAAIRDFQQGAGLKPSGEVSRELFQTLKIARSHRDIAGNSPLPPPPATAAASTGQEPKPPESKAPESKAPESKAPESKAPEAKPPEPKPPEPAQQASAEPPPVRPPPPPIQAPGAAEVERGLTRTDVPKIDAPALPAPEVEKPIDIGKPAPPPPPPTSAEFARLSAPPADPDAWPRDRTDQVKAIQALLRELKFYNSAIDGIASGGTRSAIREYEHMAGLKVTGEPSKAVFESLKEMRSLMGGKR